MDIYAMHVLFRTLGQQQGLQLVRGILSESIDEFLNEAIIQTTRVAVLGNTQVPKDVRTPQYTKISPFNSFHTLFCTVTQNVNVAREGGIVSVDLTKTPLCIANFVVKYKNNKTVDCRLIESERLYQTLNDYLNRASRDYPIVSLVNGNSDTRFDIALFTGGLNDEVGALDINYVRMPVKVHLDEEDSSKNKHCDLPEHLHTFIVELAVETWFNSLGLSSKQPQQNNNNNNQ